MGFYVDNESFNPFAIPQSHQQQPDGTVRKQLFSSPAASSTKSFQYPRTTMSPMHNNNHFLSDQPFLTTPQPTRVETLSARKRPATANIQGTPSIRKRIVCTNPEISHSRQAVDIAAWLNHELLHPLHPPSPGYPAVNFPQYRLSQDSCFLRQTVDLHTLFHSNDFFNVRSRLSHEIRTFGISFKDNVNLLQMNSSARRKFIWSILLNYHPGWLLPALCVLFNSNFAVDLDIALHVARKNQHQGQDLHQKEEEVILMRFLEDVLVTALLSPRQHVFSRLSKENFVQSTSPLPPAVERTNFHHLVLQRALELVFLLDAAKSSPSISIHGDPPLFRPESPVRSSAEFVSKLNSEFVAVASDLTKFFLLRGFRLLYEVPACEFKRSLYVSSISEDLRDGIRLCKIVSLVTKNRQLLCKVKVPSSSEMQRQIQERKNYNVDLAMRSLVKFAYTKLKQRIVWYSTSADIVSGNLSKTLSFMWQVVALWRDIELLKSNELNTELDIVKATFRRNKRHVARLGQKQTTEMSLSELSPSIVSPSNLCVYERCENPNRTLVLEWCAVVCGIYGLKVRDFTESFRDGSALCLILQHYYPDFVSLSDIVRVNATENRPSDQLERETMIAQRNFDLFTSRVRMLGHFPHIPISVETALGPGFISEDKQQTFGRAIDVLISYLFSQLVVKKRSLGLGKQTELMLQDERDRAVRDQAAGIITRALQHVHVKERMEAIDASPRSRTASPFGTSPSHLQSPRSGLGNPSLRESNFNQNSGDRFVRKGSAKKSKPPARSPLSGPTTYEKYLQQSPLFNASPRTKQNPGLGKLVRNKYPKSPVMNVTHDKIFLKASSPSRNRTVISTIDNSRKRWAVDIISSHYQSHKARRAIRIMKESIILLQACARGYLARKQFLGRVDAPNNDNNANTPSPVYIGANEVTSPTVPTVEEMDRIMSPVSSSVELTFDMLPRIQEHMKTLAQFTKRMKDHEQKFVIEENKKKFSSVTEEPNLRLEIPPASIISNETSTQTLNVLQAPVPSGSGHGLNNESSNMSELSNTPQSAVSEAAESSQQTWESGETSGVSRSPEHHAPIPIDVSQSQVAEPARVSQPSDSTQVQPAPVRKGSWLWGPMKWAGASIARSILSVGVEASNQVDGAMAVSNEAMAVPATSQILDKIQDVEDRIAVCQSAIRRTSNSRPADIHPQSSTSSPVHNQSPPSTYSPGHNQSPFSSPDHNRSPTSSPARNENVNEDLVKDSLHFAAQARFEEVINERLVERALNAENSRKRKMEIQSLTEQARDESVAHAKAMHKVEENTRELESIVSSFERYLSQLDNLTKTCDKGKGYVNRRNSVVISSEEKNCDQEIANADDMFKSYDVQRLEESLMEAENSFHETMSRIQNERRKRLEVDTCLNDLVNLQGRDQMVMQADMTVVNEQLRNSFNVFNRLDEIGQKISDEVVYPSEEEESDDDMDMRIIEPTQAQLSALNAMACNFGLFAKIDRERKETVLEEALEKADDSFVSEMARCASLRRDSWLNKKQRDMTLHSLEKESTVGLEQYVKDENHDQNVQLSIESQLAEYQVAIAATDELEAKCLSADATMESLLWKAVQDDNQPIGDDIAESFAVTLSEELKHLKRSLETLLEDAEERHNEWWQSNFEAKMTSWVHNKEMEVTLKELLEQDGDDVEELDTFMGDIDSELALINSEYKDSQSVLVEPMIIVGEGFDFSVNDMDDNALEISSYSNNTVELKAFDRLSKEACSDMMMERLEEAENRFSSHQSSKHIDNASAFARRKGAEIRLREAERNVEQGQVEYLNMVSILDSEVKQSELTVTDSFAQCMQFNCYQDNSNLDLLEDIGRNEDSSSAPTEFTGLSSFNQMFHTRCKEQTKELLDSAMDQFNEYMEVAFVRNMTQLMERKNVELRLALIHEEELQRRNELEEENSLIGDEVLFADEAYAQISSSTEYLYSNTKDVDPIDDFEHTDDIWQVPFVLTALIHTADDLVHALDKKQSYIKDVYATVIGEMEARDELEEIIAENDALVPLEDDMPEELDTITLTISEAPLSPTINDDMPELDIPELDIRTSDNIMTSPYLHVVVSEQESEPKFEPISSKKDTSIKKVIDDEEFEEVASLRQANRSSVRHPLQDVSSGHIVELSTTLPHSTPHSDCAHAQLSTPRPHFVRDEYKSLFSSGQPSVKHEEEDDFVSLSSYASRPSSSVNSSLLTGQGMSPGSRLSPATALMNAARERAVSKTSIDGNRIVPEINSGTPRTSFWRIDQSPLADGSVVLGKLSAELDALRMELSPSGSSDFLVTDSGSISRMQGVMRRISMAAATATAPLPGIMTVNQQQSSSADGPLPSTILETSMAENRTEIETAAESSISSSVSILRNVLMVMRQCIRSELHTPLVKLGMQIVSDFCSVQECLLEVQKIEDSVDIISTCVQFYRDDEDIFACGADVLLLISDDDEGVQLLKEHGDVLGRLEKVAQLMEEQVQRMLRNVMRQQKAKAIGLALGRRKTRKSSGVSLAEEINKSVPEVPRNEVIDSALKKLSIVIERSRQVAV